MPKPPKGPPDIGAFLYDGSLISSRDIRYLIGQYANQSKQKAVVATLQATLDHNPQATMFRADATGAVSPVNFVSPVKPTRTVQANIVVVGAELSSLSTAVEAAERGAHVVVLYAGPLGGMSADSGGNLRYFDIQNPSSHPIGQQKLWHEGLGVKAWVTIPPDTNRRLGDFLRTKYAGRIDLVQTKSYDGLWVEMDAGRIGAVETPEGTRVAGRWFIDADPESRVAEKAGVPFTLETPHMSNGMTFDVQGLDEDAFDNLGSDDKVEPKAIEKLVGVTDQQVAQDPIASDLVKKLRVNIDRDFFVTGATHAYGYCGLAMGFGFYMACRAIKEPSEDFKWLNARRYVSGFNIARFEQQASFNSISYRFLKNWLQHSHSLESDPTFSPLARTEIPALQTYLRYVAGSDKLTVRMPPQFYVRSASAFFKLIHPYAADEFNGPKGSGYFTHYPMDLRDLFPRDPGNWKAVMAYVKEAKGKNFWNARASAAETTVPNLFLVNKCGVTPQYSGGQRTEQSAINLGAAVADALAAGTLR